MGNWKLEAFKMSLYMMFPTGVFWWFNQPEFFEDWMMEKRRELFPPQNPIARQNIQHAIDQAERRRQESYDQDFKENEL